MSTSPSSAKSSTTPPASHGVPSGHGTLETIVDELKPEAAYFGPIEGARGGDLVVNFDEPSQIPAIAEPLFLGLGATIQISPVFTPDEMPTETLQQVAQKYGS